jgi:hypothetical protein
MRVLFAFAIIRVALVTFGTVTAKLRVPVGVV